MSAYGKFTPPPGARVVTGVEINTTYRGNEVHCWATAWRPMRRSCSTMIEHNRDARRVRAQRMVDQFQRAGYGITYERGAARGTRRKGDWASARRQSADRQGPRARTSIRRFAICCAAGMPGYVPSLHITPQEAIERITARPAVSQFWRIPGA